MSKKIKRITAFVLSILMVLGSLYFGQSWADDEETETASITATFKDNSGNPVKGLNVEYYKRDTQTTQTKVGAVTTDASGVATISNLEMGEYLLVPDQANYTLAQDPVKNYTKIGDLEGYAVSLNSQSAKSAHITYTLYVKTGSITIVKATYDKDAVSDNASSTPSLSVPLSGAKFVLCDESGNEIEGKEITTSSNGTATFEGLAPGKYFVKEVKAPEGYVLDSEKKAVVVTGGNNTKVNVANFPEVTITVNKLDTDTDKAIKGATIGLYEYDKNASDKAGNLISSAVTGDNGQVTFTVKAGNYTVKEISPAPGYRMGGNAGTDKSVYCYSGTFLKDRTVNLYNKKGSKITVKKVDFYNSSKVLKGAVLTAYYANWDGTDEESGFTYNTSDVAFTVTTTDGETDITSLLEDGKAYVIKETAAPSGYDVTDESEYHIIWGVKKNATLVYSDNTDLIFRDKPAVTEQKVTFIKKDADTGKAVSGAKIGIYKVNKDGSLGSKIMLSDVEGFEIVDGSFITSSKTFETKLAPGNYAFVEEQAPAGYSKTAPIKFTTVNNVSVSIEKTMTDKLTQLDVRKVDKDERNTLLGGATIQILNEDKEVVKTITTQEGKVTRVTGLEVGTYYLHETKAPEGYDLTADVQFEITDEPNKVFEVEMADGLVAPENTLKISKKDSETENYLSGAVIDVYRAYTEDEFEDIQYTTIQNPIGQYAVDIDVTDIDFYEDYILLKVATFTTKNDKNVYTLTNLPNGKYFVCESEAPSGYVLTDEYVEVDFDSRISVVKEIVVENNPTKVSIQKVDADNNLINVSGAKLQVLGENNTVIDSWTSNGSAHMISGKLEVGKTYKIHEVEAPQGYEKADDYSFTVEEKSDVQYVKFENEKEPFKYTLNVSKVIAGSDPVEYVPNAVLALEKLNGTNYNLVTRIVTDGSVKKIENLQPGTYKLSEVNTPDGYLTAEPIVFTLDKAGVAADENGEYSVVMEDEYTTVVIKKLEYDARKGETPETANKETAKPAYGAHLLITDERGYEVASTDGFVITENEDCIVLKHTLGVNKTYTITELDAPGRYNIAEPLKIDIKNTTDVQEFVMWDEHRVVEYDLEVKKLDTEGNLLAGAKMKLEKLNENGKYEVVDEFTSSTSAKKFKVEAGTYRLSEIEAPAGYKKAASKVFTLTEDQTRLEKGKNVYDTKAVQSLVDEDIVVNINKLASDTMQPLAGASFEIYEVIDRVDKEGVIDVEASKLSKNPVYSFVSSGSTEVIKNVFVEGKEYVIIETSAPQGYELSQPITFKAPVDEGINIIDTLTKTYKVEIAKVSHNGKKYIEGARLALVRVIEGKEYQIGEAWTSTDIAGHMFTLEAGTYRVKELQAPAGYRYAGNASYAVEFVIGNEKDTTDSSNVITYSNGSKQVNVVNEQTETVIKKIDSQTGELIGGATLNVYDEDGELVATWITEKGKAHTIEGLIAGKTYTLKETNAPRGYDLPKSGKTFTVSKYATTNEVVFENTKTQIKTYNVSFKKADATTGKEVVGAKMKLEKVDSTGKVISTWTWTSTKEDKVIEGLTPGDYILTETLAPTNIGYIKAEAIKFTLKEDGSSSDKVVMKDDYTKVEIRKLDKNENFVVGATLELRDAKGKVITTWTTEAGKGHRFSHLPVGKYTVYEKEVPAGYVKAAPITFEVLPVSDLQVVKMYDELKADVTTYDLYISKKDLTNKEELSGATLVLTQDGKEIERWISTSQAHVIKALPYGEYVLTEISAPSGYVKAESITIKLDKNGKSQSVYTMYDDVTKVDVYKQDSATKENLKGAKLALYDESGKEVASWVTDGTAKHFEKLAHGKYTLKELEVPSGYNKAADITFTVSDDNKTTLIYMYDSKITTKTETPSNPVVTKTPTPEVKQPVEEKTEEVKEVVATGDNNNIIPFVFGGVFFLIAATGTIVLVKRKKEDDKDAE